MPHCIAITIALGAALAAAVSPALADPVFDYNMGASLEHSDNINYSRTDPVSQNVLTPQLSFAVSEQGSVLTANAAGTLQYVDYLGGAFDDEFRTLFSGVADWHISPGRFDWIFVDNIGRQPINAFASNTPTNQQQTNVFSTGPTLRAKFSDILRGQFDLLYTNSYADTSKDFNSNRLGAVGSLLYQLDPIDTLSGSVTASRVRYIETVSQPFDYDRNDAYIGYQHKTRVLTIETAVGYSWLDLRGADSRSSSLLRGSLHWTPNTTTTLGVNINHEYSDAAQDLVFTPGQIDNVGVGSGLNGAVIAPQVYLEDRIGFDVSHHVDSFRIGFAPFWRKLAYIDDPTSDQRSIGYYADAAWYFRPAFWLGAFAGQERREYTQIARTDDDLAFGLSLNLQRTRHWLWSVAVEHQRRGSNGNGIDNGIASSYSENSIMVSITYRR